MNDHRKLWRQLICPRQRDRNIAQGIPKYNFLEAIYVYQLTYETGCLGNFGLSCGLFVVVLNENNATRKS